MTLHTQKKPNKSKSKSVAERKRQCAVAEIENTLAKIEHQDLDIKNSSTNRFGNITIALKTEESKEKLMKRLAENVKLQQHLLSLI